MRRRPRTSFVSLTPDQRREVEKLSETPGWRILGQDQLPSFFPESLRTKIDSALVISSSTMSSERTYLVCNAVRVDESAGMLDQEPFAVSVLSSGASTGGMFVHHGDWEGRTESPPEGFWDIVDESGVGDYFLANPPSNSTGGLLEDLPVGHKNAFYRSVELLKDAEER